MLCQRKIPVTPSGIEPATFRLVAHCHKCGVQGAFHLAIKQVESQENSFSIVTRHRMNCREKWCRSSAKAKYFSVTRHPTGCGGPIQPVNKIGTVSDFARGRAAWARKGTLICIIYEVKNAWSLTSMPYTYS